MLRLLTKWPKSRQKFYYYSSVSLHFFIEFYVSLFFLAFFHCSPCSFIACQSFFSSRFQRRLPEFFFLAFSDALAKKRIYVYISSGQIYNISGTSVKKSLFYLNYCSMFLLFLSSKIFNKNHGKRSIFGHYPRFFKYIEWALEKGWFFFKFYPRVKIILTRMRFLNLKRFLVIGDIFIHKNLENFLKNS